MPDTSKDYDIFIIGGGINGASIARDAVGRGYTVGLCEKDDFASHTSSASTKLIHGGLRYLEFYEFKMVREALKEREILLHSAPHVIWPMRFILPHVSGMRPKWMMRMGLFLYDYLAARKTLKASNGVNLKKNKHGGLSKAYTHGFEYSDCWVEDARFVILNLMDAHTKGADIYRDMSFVSAKADDDGYWMVNLSSKTIRTKYLVNATGAYASTVGALIGDETYTPRKLRLVQGSHIVVPQLFSDPQSLILQMDDGRIIFIIPYEGEFTLIGTTDTDITAEGPDAAKVRDEEIEYLIKGANQYLPKDKHIEVKDIVWQYSGIRPLVDEDDLNPQTLSRDYELRHSGVSEEPLLLTVHGGKLTTSRHLAEEAVNQISKRLDKKTAPWTHQSHLPGGDFDPKERQALIKSYQSRYDHVPSDTVERLLTAYGTRIEQVLGNELGDSFGGGVYQCELDYVIENEWVRSGEDFLYRRSKCGLHLNQREKDKINNYIKDKTHGK